MAVEEEDYEALPSSSGPLTHMSAGAIAGILEHCVMYPVDAVKTRLQCLRPAQDVRYTGLWDGVTRLLRHEGVVRSMRGAGAVVGGAGPAHALYFSVYECVKLQTGRQLGVNSNLAVGLAGTCATVCHDSVMTPADAVKQRLQMFNSPYRNVVDCLRSVLRTEGAVALFRAFPTQLAMSLPQQVVHFLLYERCQDIVNAERRYVWWSHVLSGGVAGGVAAALTTPLDVCKTLLNTQERCALDACHCERVVGLRGALSAVLRLESWPGLFKGLSARVLFSAPGCAISWFVYETFKRFVLLQPAPTCVAASSPRA